MQEHIEELVRTSVPVDRRDLPGLVSLRGMPPKVRHACDQRLPEPVHGPLPPRIDRSGSPIVNEKEHDRCFPSRAKTLDQAFDIGLLSMDRRRKAPKDNDDFKLALDPGLSTAETVTSVSGGVTLGNGRVALTREAGGTVDDTAVASVI